MNAQILNQVRFANSIRHMVLINGKAVCKHCAFRDYIKVSHECRPLVSEWVDYDEVRCHRMERCDRCGC